MSQDIYSELQFVALLLMRESKRDDRVDLVLDFVVGNRCVVIFEAQEKSIGLFGDRSHYIKFMKSRPPTHIIANDFMICIVGQLDIMRS